MIAPVTDPSLDASGPVADAGRLAPVERRWAWIGALVAVVLFWLVATCVQPWNLFARGPFSTDFYDAQARALVHGHLDVPSSVAGIEGFVIDGKTQIYFGIGPALLRVPLSGVSDVFDRRLSLVSELVAVLVVGLAAARLLKRARSSVHDAPEVSPWWYAVAAVAVSFGTPLLFFTSFPLVYHEAELWGAAAGLAGLDLVLRWWRDPTRRHFVEAVALAVFAMSVRPSSGASPAVALGLFGLVLLWRRSFRRGLVTIVGAVLPILAFATVNWLRFRSFSDVPFPAQVFSQFDANRQETLAANNGSLFGLKFLPTNALRYFSPFAIRFDRLFPFVSWPTRATVIGDAHFDAVDRSGSIMTGAPVLSLLAVLGAGWTIVRDRTRQWSVLVVAAIVPTATTFTFGYLAHRYLADLVPVVVLLAAPGVWLVLRRSRRWTRPARGVVSVALAAVFLLGMWNQIGLAISTRAFGAIGGEQRALDLAEFQYSLDDTLFGGAAPNVVRSTDGVFPPEPAPGTILVVGDCSAVYRSDGYGWLALERRVGGGRRFVFDAPVRADERLVTGDGWEITLVGTDRGTIVRYTSADRVIDSPPVTVPEGATATFDVVADPLPLGAIGVRVDGRTLLDAIYVTASGAGLASDRVSRAAPAPFCSSLVGRSSEGK